MIDLLAFGAHPDDIEISSAGTVISHVQQGKKVVIADLTRGELGTRGTKEIRDQESIAATKILGIDERLNLNFRDGFFKNDEEHQLEVIKIIRHYKPELVIAPAIFDRHPDHGRGGALINDAFFLSGLRMIETSYKDQKQDAFRPRLLLHYIQDRLMPPDIVVDTTAFFEQKMESIKAFKSQFYDPASDDPETYISKKGFLKNIEARDRDMGRPSGFDFGEGFVSKKSLGVKSLFDIY